LTTILSNGLVIGAIYGLVALGITLVYKKSGVLNFAHGEVGMVPATAPARHRSASPPAAPTANGPLPNPAGEQPSDHSPPEAARVRYPSASARPVAAEAL
jgi:hypothetical protein